MADIENEAIGPAEADRLFSRLVDYEDVFLAVSGGPDSTALMHLVAAWRRRTDRPPTVHVLSVDHGLRAQAVAEVEAVRAQAEDLGLTAKVLTWCGSKPAAGLQAAAREARYRLMIGHIHETVTDPARAALVTAHHRDDLAETVLMRLARGSGVDGLAAIQPMTFRDGVALLRPLLGMPCARLRGSLHAAGAIWSEDPSNTDPRFERVRLRDVQQAAQQLGLESAALALTARRMQRARRALEGFVDDWLQPHLAAPMLINCGVFAWPWPARAIPDEIAIRALMRLLPAIGGLSHPIRLLRAERVWEEMQRESFAGATLGNCVITGGRGGQIHIYREPHRAPLPTITVRTEGRLNWDDRFEISIEGPGAADTGARVRGLDRADLAHFEVDRSPRALPCPLDMLLATPVIEDASGVVAIPALKLHRKRANVRFSGRFMTGRISQRHAGTPDDGQ